jgi:hypothetical protein
MLMLWMLYLEFVPSDQVTLVLLVCTIIMVSAAYWMSRAAHFRYAFGLAALAALLLGLVFMYAADSLTTLVMRGRILGAYLSELLPKLLPRPQGSWRPLGSGLKIGGELFRD